MRYLMRDGAPLTDGQWESIDKAVVAEASKILVGRRFLDVASVGAQTQSVPVDVMAGVKSAKADFWARDEVDAIDVKSRKLVDLTTIYADFMVSWRDVEDESAVAAVQAARDAAVLAARREDAIIFYGDASQGIDGVFTAAGVNELPLSDWNDGENPVIDIAKGLEVLLEKGCSGERVLVVSTDLYAKLHRIQPGTGIMEVDRVRSLVGKLLRSSQLQKSSACLLYCEPQNMDLVVGQDMITAYMGNEGMDHVFRVMETMTPRIKRPSAIAVFR